MTSSANLFRILCILSTLGFVSLVGGCKSQSAQHDPASNPVAAPMEQVPSAHVGKADVSPEFRQAVNDLIASYDRVSALLVVDETDGLTDAVSTLKNSAGALGAGAPSSMKDNVSSLQTAAATLAELGTADIGAVRKQFGEVSRSLVSLVSSETSLATGLFVFECPMAQGYKRWVQSSAEIANPYMGTRMPRCGSEVGW